MTPDEEFLKLARDSGFEAREDNDFKVFAGDFRFDSDQLIAYSREIERRALERAAEKCNEWGEAKWQAFKLSPPNHPHRGNPYVVGRADGGGECAFAIRAMIKEKE